MKLTKELIIKVLNEFSEKKTELFSPELTFVTEEYYSDVADEILSHVEDDSEPQPQLQQANVRSSAEDEYDFEDEDYDEEWDEDDYEERRAEEQAEYAATCTCGAWVFGKDGKAYHVADCYCGAQ